MNQLLTDKLFSEFPELFRGRKEPVKGKLMALGFVCGDGWFDIIYNLSKDITDYAKINNLEPFPKAFEVKQKFGGLVFYLVQPVDNTIYNLTRKAQDASYKVCELCGSSDNVRGNKSGYKQYLCDACRISSEN